MGGKFFCKTIIIYRQTEICHHAFFPNAPAPFGFSPCFIVFFGPGSAVGLWQCAGVITVEAAAARAGDAGPRRAARRRGTQPGPAASWQRTGAPGERFAHAAQ